MSTSSFTPGDGSPFDDGSQSLIFGKYEVIRRLALGGMGEVFLARQTGVAVDRLVILKSLLPELAEQDGFVDQFLDEARVAATLNHPNIVGIYEVGLWNGVYFIAMEFIHGGDLSKLQRTAAKKGFGIPFQVSARMVHDASLGLDHAHHAHAMDGSALHIVHRDISPQNIMVRGDGVTKVVDFGIAKASNRSTRTATGMLKGKLQYMAPEQVKGDDIDARADQFALGVVLWELTTNRRLFKGENELKTLEKLLKDDVPPPSSVVNGFPPGLEAVIMRMLSRRPEDRYARLRDTALDLRSYLDGCSRAVGETEVAEFVRSILGEQLAEVTKNITPSQENFLISLDSTADPGATPTTMTQAIELRRKRGIGLAAGLIGAVALIGVAGVFLFGGEGADDPLIEVPRATVAPGDQDIIARSKMRSAYNDHHRLTAGKDGATQLEIDAPLGAKVIVDGKLWPEPVPTVVKGLAAGSHKIVLQQRDNEVEFEARIEAEPALYVLKAKPSGAEISFRHPDGYEMSIKAGSDLGKMLGAGQHTVTLQSPGYQSERVALTIKPGENKGKTVALTKLRRTKRSRTERKPPAEEKRGDKPKAAESRQAPAQPAEDGFLTVRTEPWAKISIDGQPKGSTPLFKVQLSPGKHKVKLVNEAAGINVTKSVRIKPGENTKIVWKLE